MEVVHGNLTPDNILWDGANLFVMDFRYAYVRGTRRRNFPPPSLWGGLTELHFGCSGEQDDVFRAAWILKYISTGHEAAVADGRSSAPLDYELENWLGGLDAQRSPASASEVLGRIQGRSAPVPTPQVQQAVAQALEEFNRYYDERAGPSGPHQSDNRRRLFRARSRQAQPATGVMPARSPAGEVRCPICLHRFAWPALDTAELYEDTASEYRVIPRRFIADLTGPGGDQQWPRFHNFLRSVYIRCPNPSLERDHWLRYNYGHHGDPIIIFLVGRTYMGKTSLLAAMTRALMHEKAVRDLGITYDPIDRHRHDSYVRNIVSPLFDNSQGVHATPQHPDRPVEFRDAVVVHRGSERRPIAFFDVSGEDLLHESTSTSALSLADGLIFVIDPTTKGARGAEAWEDPTFDIALRRLTDAGRRDPSTGLVDVNALIAASKADLIWTDPLVRKWYLRGSDRDDVGAGALHGESRDVYAFLRAGGMEPALVPAKQCQRVSLHFTSAYGCPAIGDGFHYRLARAARPSGVDRLLLRLLAMTGILGDEMTMVAL